MLRYFLSPKWIPFHLFASSLLGGFGWLGIWQWELRYRVSASTGETVLDWQNTFYAFQWWIFAFAALWFWWKFISDDYLIRQRKLKSK
jgi:hypothetical protein